MFLNSVVVVISRESGESWMVSNFVLIHNHFGRFYVPSLSVFPSSHFKTNVRSLSTKHISVECRKTKTIVIMSVDAKRGKFLKESLRNQRKNKQTARSALKCG